MNKIKGVTLLELLIAVLVMSILASVAGPSFMQSFERQKLIDATEQLYSNLQLARSEAISRNVQIHIKFNGLTSTNWRFGISNTYDCFPLLDTNINDKSCVLPIDNGDGVFNPDDDNVVFRVLGSEYDQISLRANWTTSQIVHVAFDQTDGSPDVSGTFSVQNQSGDQAFVLMNKIGVIKICSNDLSEYKACS